MNKLKCGNVEKAIIILEINNFAEKLSKNKIFGNCIQKVFNCYMKSGERPERYRREYNVIKIFY